MKSTKSYGSPVAVVWTRPRKCADKADGTNCGNKTRMALIVPTRESDEDEMEMSCVSLCGECIETGIVNLAKAGQTHNVFPFVAYEDVDTAIMEAIKRISISIPKVGDVAA